MLGATVLDGYGDGETTRDFSYVDNAVHANLLAASAPRAFAGEIANVAAGRRVSLNDLVGQIGQILNSHITVQHTDPRPGDVRHSLADVSRAGELFGYEPLTSWEDGLPRTAVFLRRLAAQRGLVCAA